MNYPEAVMPNMKVAAYAIALLALVVAVVLVGCGVAPSACVEPVSAEVQTETARITYTNGYERLSVGTVTVATATQDWDIVLDSLGYELVPCGCWDTVNGQHVAEVMP